MQRAVHLAKVLLRRALIAAGLCAILGLIWLASGVALLIDAPLNVSAPPARAEAIVCVGAGTTAHDLPTDDGWQRIATSVALFADGLAPRVVFTGRGNAAVSEAEIYADAARWLGLPSAAIRLDPLPASTAEQPDTLLRSPGTDIRLESPILLVASTLHSRRVLMTFHKRGYTSVIVVSEYTARTRLAGGRRENSALPSFSSDHKRYDDLFFRLRVRSDRFLGALREWAAIAAYRWQGRL